MTRENNIFVRELMICAVSITLTAAFGMAAWGITDRMHWAAKEQQMDDTAKSVTEIKNRIDVIPQNFTTRQEFDEVRQLIRDDHTETIIELGQLGARIDRLAIREGLPRATLQLRGSPSADLSVR
jgi:hypothetical protein